MERLNGTDTGDNAVLAVGSEWPRKVRNTGLLWAGDLTGDLVLIG